MSDKKGVSGWGGDDEDEAPESQNLDMLRKALAVNPAMKGTDSTTDILAKITAAQQKQAAAPAKAPGPQGPDLSVMIAQTRQKYVEQRKKLREEIAKLQALEKQIGPDTLNTVIDQILRIDPNMTSVKTQAMLDIEKPFLTEIGFSGKKLIERQRK